jgi:hypothetical protein
MIDLIYQHYNDITDQRLKRWVRNDLFGTVGLRSDPPGVVAAVLRDALKQYVTRRRLSR